VAVSTKREHKARQRKANSSASGASKCNRSRTEGQVGQPVPITRSCRRCFKSRVTSAPYAVLKINDVETLCRLREID
jgi:hypothetical protein